jgi:hypothetical protein
MSSKAAQSRVSLFMNKPVRSGYLGNWRLKIAEFPKTKVILKELAPTKKAGRAGPLNLRIFS